MKQLLTLAFMLFATCAFAQDIPKQSDTGRMVFVSVVDAPAKTKEQLYNNLKIGLADLYNSIKDVSRVDDAEAGVFLIKAAFPFDYPSGFHSAPGKVNYTLRVDVKDGKYRAAVYGFAHKSLDSRYGDGGPLTSDKPANGTMQFSRKQWTRCKEQAMAESSSLFSSLQKLATSDALQKSDW